MLLLIVVLTALGLAAGPARAAVTYGLGDSPGTFARCATSAPCCGTAAGYCPAGAVSGFYDSPSFLALTSAQSAHRLSQIRLFVDLDAAQEWNGSTTAPGCTFSRSLDQAWYDGANRLHPAGESIQNLLTGLIEARADGLTPVVSIAGYGSPHARPAWKQPAPDPTTVAGYWDYRCGVQGILNAVSRLPAADQPHIWEAINEPNLLDPYRGVTGDLTSGCGVTLNGNFSLAGAGRAACDYVDATTQIHGFAGHAGDTVIAGVLSGTSTDYVTAYAAALAHDLPPALYPRTWAVHDYGDVTRSYDALSLSGLAAFDQALHTATGSLAQDLWVTEAGVELTDREPAPECSPTPDLRYTLSQCVSGQPGRQFNAAQAFFALPQAGTAVPITHLFWYQWQAGPNWDSALTDTSGNPRTSWCVFYGSGTCSGSPDAG